MGAEMVSGYLGRGVRVREKHCSECAYLSEMTGCAGCFKWSSYSSKWHPIYCVRVWDEKIYENKQRFKVY